MGIGIVRLSCTENNVASHREADIVASLAEDAVRKALAEGETAASLVQKAKVPDFFDDLATVFATRVGSDTRIKIIDPAR